MIALVFETISNFDNKRKRMQRQKKMSVERNNTNELGDYSTIEPIEAPWLVAQNLSTLKSKDLKKIINDQNEEILALKLRNFEAQIEINQRNDEIKRMKEYIVHREKIAVHSRMK